MSLTRSDVEGAARAFARLRRYGQPDVEKLNV
jgi:hypothetical protein